MIPSQPYLVQRKPAFTFIASTKKDNSGGKMVAAQTQTGVVSPIYVQMKDSADSLAGLSPQQQRKITRMSHMRLKKIYEKILIVRKIEKVE